MGSAPKTPDPSTSINTATQVATGQAGFNKDAATQSQTGSMTGIDTTFGKLSYTADPNSPSGYKASVSLSPEQQQLYDTITGTKSTAGLQGGNLLSNANYGSADPGKVIGDATGGNTRALMDAQMAYQQPYQQQATNSLDNKLRNQGLFPGTPGYDNAMTKLRQDHAIANAKSAADFEGQAYGQAFNNFMTPANLGMALGGFGAPTTPNSSFVQTPGLQIAPANLTGAYATASDAAMKKYEADQKQYSAMLTGAFGIPSALLGGWAGSPTGGATISKGITNLFSATA